MKKKFVIVIRIFAVICLFAGAFIFCFPKISQVTYDYSVQRNMAKMEEESEKGSRYEELYERLKVYNSKLFLNGQKELKDPFSYSQPNFDLSEYGIENNTIGYIKIEKMSITLPIILGANRENMNHGAVHMTQTSFPIGGVNTNAVIAAHRGVKLVMFREIEKLNLGDIIEIINFRETLHYEVTEIKVIEPTDIEKILIRSGKDMVTLLTCHPFKVNNMRYAVFCERIEK